MSLLSSRFKGIPQLAQAASNAPWLSTGARGHGVHLLQSALIDLGYPMPRSTGGADDCPDGIFGSETHAAVQKFQKSSLGGQSLTDDGAVGRMTMSKFDTAAAQYQHRVSVRLVSVVLGGPTMFLMQAEAIEIFQRYGIRIDIQHDHTPHVLDSDTDANLLQASHDVLTLAERKRILRDSMGLTINPLDVLIVQVANIPDAKGDMRSDPDVAIGRVSTTASPSDLAHEIGHALLTPFSGFDREDHDRSIRNLMFRMTHRRPPHTLRRRQLTEMRNHPRCQKI